MKALFQCDYCGTIGSQHEIKIHEKLCLSNPNAKICQNCKHFRCREKERREEESRKQFEEWNKTRELSNIFISSGLSTSYWSNPEIYECFLGHSKETCKNNDYANFTIQPIKACEHFEKRDTIITWKTNNLLLTGGLSQNLSQLKELDPCENCDFFKKLKASREPYIGDAPCEWCSHSKFKITW